MSDPFDGFACINGQLVDKACRDMTDQELADFVSQGAWRRNAYRSDPSAEWEIAERGRRKLESEAGDAK